MKFPNRIYVKQESDGDDTYLVADNNFNSMGGAVGEKVFVGVYVLETKVVATTKVEAE